MYYIILQKKVFKNTILKGKKGTIPNHYTVIRKSNQREFQLK